MTFDDVGAVYGLVAEMRRHPTPPFVGDTCPSSGLIVS